MNVENRIRGFALRVDNLIPPIIGNGSAPVYFRQKYFGIERELSIAFHSRPSLRTSSSFEERRPFYTMAPKRDNPLCRSVAHLSKGVLGLAVDIRLVACRRWQLW